MIFSTPWIRHQFQKRLPVVFASSTVTAYAYSNASEVSRQRTLSEPQREHESCDNNTSSACQANEAKNKLFENQCLKRQMYEPKVPYPAWDYNWDGRVTPETSLEGNRNGLQKTVQGKTRHIILVRHGQYDESFPEDHLRRLTPLGRLQAIRTGRRLRQMMEGAYHFDEEEMRGPCTIRAIQVSDMKRAKETADLIASELGLSVDTPDPDLNEALPAPMIPIRPDIIGATEEIDKHQARIERAFHRYFYRDSSKEGSKDDKSSNIHEEKDEFEIIVCHGNVIRYMFCRALQLPPEAWLRMSTFNCSLTYLVIRPSGSVSCRMLGDIGHLQYDESTFSSYHGFKW